MPYAYERHEGGADPAYGYLVGAAVAKGRITRMDTAAARAAPGVLAVVTTLDHARPLPLSRRNTASLFGGDVVQHYHQAIAVVVAATFKQARGATAPIRTEYRRTSGRYDLARAVPDAPLEGGSSGEGSGAPAIARTGDFAGAFAAAPVKIARTYTTPDESHAIMEPFATVAEWAGRPTDALDVQPDDRVEPQCGRHGAVQRPSSAFAWVPRATAG